MSLYSDFAGRRTGQIFADLTAIATIVVAILVAVAVYGAIAAFAQIGAQLEASGLGFQQTMVEVGVNLGQVPLIGGGIRVPFDAASDAGGALASAGQSQQDLVYRTAVFAAILVALGPILVVVAVWLIPRLLFVRRSREVRALAKSPDGPELLALRALARRPLRELVGVDPRPLDAWRRGDADAIRGLARLELARAGVRLG